MYRPILISLAFSTICLAQCTQDMVRGAWAGYYLGTITTTQPDGSAPVATPAAQLVVGKIDYQGNFTGKGYANIGGQLMTGTIKGNVQVNADCTGSNTFTLNVDGVGPLPGTGTERLVVLDNGKEIRAMTTKGLLGNPAGTGYYRRISASDPQCTQDMIHGLYATNWDGFWIPQGTPASAATPYSQLGTGGMGYDGKVVFAGTMSVGSYVGPTGGRMQMSVNADCTATSISGIGGVAQLVVLNNGDELLQISMQYPGGSAVIIGHSKRISTLPAAPSW